MREGVELPFVIASEHTPEYTKAIEKFGPQYIEALARKTAAEADWLELEVKHEEAGSDTNRVYTFFADFNEYEPLEEFVTTVETWLRRDEERDITILLNSRGGYCQHGMTMYDWIRIMRKTYKAQIEIVCLGWAASMGSIVMQAASHRVMAREAKMLIHEVAYNTWDGYYDQKTGVHEEELDEAMKVQRAGNRILAARSDISLAEIEERTRKTDWWLTARECLEYGFCDEVR